MKDFLLQTFLNIPIYIWVLQLLYVALALAILFVFVSIDKRTLWEQILFVAVVIVINVIWRLALKR